MATTRNIHLLSLGTVRASAFSAGMHIGKQLIRTGKLVKCSSRTSAGEMYVSTLKLKPGVTVPANISFSKSGGFN
jgi:hypothetical protein